MSKARLVITAVTVEKRPVSEVAKSYGVARSWIYTLLDRYRAEGDAAFEPRSRRHHSSPAPRRPSSWCCGSASSSATRDWTPALRRSAGT